jgi:hypothetical protein
MALPSLVKNWKGPGRKWPCLFLLSPQLFLSSWCYSWTSGGEPRHSGFKFQTAVPSLWRVIHLMPSLFTQRIRKALSCFTNSAVPVFTCVTKHLIFHSRWISVFSFVLRFLFVSFFYPIVSLHLSLTKILSYLFLIIMPGLFFRTYLFVSLDFTVLLHFHVHKLTQLRAGTSLLLFIMPDVLHTQ